MGNERKTEKIVRTHFEQFENIIIEEQQSDNVRIKKLLSTASKNPSGTGGGYPEFIITSKDNTLIIVIECKADVTKHESKGHNDFKNFAVDGVLLYASYLSKEFDVLAIAVSGETKELLKISHFLHLKNELKAIQILGNQLLPFNDYINWYMTSPAKFRQDYNILLDFTKKLNDKLHKNKILENQRSLLISSILIALENQAFKKSYSSHTNSENLANALVQTVSNELENAKITDKKLANLNTQFSFIKTDMTLSKKENILKDIIDEIDRNINSFIKTHQYIDVLGQLYIEFLRYANSDKGLGIVLTPPHITELFAELAEVNKDSIVYDNCTGTGGFLISAMKKMISDAKGDEAQIKKIKSKQLIGIEYQSHIFALAVSNMYIHQDGKTNILNEDCFDSVIIADIKKQNPNIGFLNPPYKSEKEDKAELEFVLKNLESLTVGGTCIAIIPMSSVLYQKGSNYELKKILLEKHTLEAVLSMPDELFFNSKVSVVTCIIIITANKPHPKNKETYFGFYKDDGFIKKRNKGRVDFYDKWEKIKEKWVEYFLNKKPEPGFSVNQKITAEMEWGPEIYLKTGYQKLTNQNFEKKLIEYNTFLFHSKIKNTVSYQRFNDTVQLKLDTNNWMYFNLSDFFDIKATKDELLNNLSQGITTPYIASSEFNNGVTDFVDESSDFGANTITANRGGSVGYFFYQPKNYLATPIDVRILVPKKNCILNQYTGLFLVTIFELEKFRFNYSRKMGTDRLKKMEIKLPTNNNLPDWDFMEKYIKSLPYSASI